MWMSKVTGDPGKMVAVQRNLRKFGIKELARTGKVDVHNFSARQCVRIRGHVCYHCLRSIFTLFNHSAAEAGNFPCVVGLEISC